MLIQKTGRLNVQWAPYEAGQFAVLGDFGEITMEFEDGGHPATGLEKTSLCSRMA